MRASACIEIRSAAEDDLRPAAEVSERHYNGDVERRLRQFEWVLAREDAHMTVALRGDRLIGYGKVEWCDWTHQESHNIEAGWYLGGIVVAPEERRAGVGRALTLARIEWVTSRYPGQPLWYFTDATNTDSCALHESLGFVEVTRDFVVPNVDLPDGGVLGRRAAPDLSVLR